MLDISVHVACPVDVLHEVDAFWLQCAMNTFEHIERLRLIVNGVEGCDEVEGLRFRILIEGAQIAGDELAIVEAFL